MTSPFVLTVLKFTFLALLYFFVYRVVKTVVVDLRGPTPPKAQRKAAKATAKPARTGKMKAPVIVIIKDAEGKKVGSRKLKGPMQIGRDEACELRPDDTFLSKFHARVYPHNGAWFVEDLGSTNGTYLNQQRL
ncbi:MAG: FHA domain-containing protein, partial [Actinomycetota bacterium]